MALSGQDDVLGSGVCLYPWPAGDIRAAGGGEGARLELEGPGARSVQSGLHRTLGVGNLKLSTCSSRNVFCATPPPSGGVDNDFTFRFLGLESTRPSLCPLMDG